MLPIVTPDDAPQSYTLGVGLNLIKGVGLFVPLTPAEDTPIITGGDGTVNFATNTAHTCKRIGDDTTNVDMAGDTKFRYPGVPDNVIVPSGINTRVVTTTIPGGALQARRWDFAIEAVTSSKYYGMNFVSPISPTQFLVVVNGRVANGGQAVYLANTAGNQNFIQFEFPDNRPRRIKLVFPGATTVQSIRTEAAYPPVRPTGNDKVLVIAADSMGAGAGTRPGYASAFDTWPQFVALMLGFDHCCNASIGGTKWVPGGAGDVAVSHFGGGRLPLALTTNPTAYVDAGSRNDSGADQAALDAITAAVGTALDATTVTKKFVMGTFTNISDVNAAVQAGAVAKGVPFIDMRDGLQAGDLGGDGVHPTFLGDINLRNRIAPRLYARGCRP